MANYTCLYGIMFVSYSGCACKSKMKSISQTISLAAVKTAYISTGIAGFMLSPLPLLNVTGVGLLKLSGQALKFYERLVIQGIAKIPTDEALPLFRESLDDINYPKDPSVSIALAISSSKSTEELQANLEMINVSRYGGIGTSRYNGEARVMSEDYMKTLLIMTPYMQHKKATANEPTVNNNPRMR